MRRILTQFAALLILTAPGLAEPTPLFDIGFGWLWTATT